MVRFIDPRDAYLDSIMEKIDMDAIRARRPRVVLDPMYGVSLTGLMTILFTARCDVDVINDRHDAFFGGHLPAPNPGEQSREAPEELAWGLAFPEASRAAP